MNVYHRSLRSQGLPGWLYCPANGGGNPQPIGQTTIDGAGLWKDPNHLRPGLGEVRLIAIGYRQGVAGGIIPNIDLRGKQLVVDIEMSNLQRQGKGAIGLWIQGSFPQHGLGGKMLNLFQTENLICQQFGLTHPRQNPHSYTGMSAVQRKTVTIPFSTSPKHWASMGSSNARADLYGDWQEPAADLNRMMQPSVWIDFGLIVIEPHDNWPDSQKFTATIKIHELRLEDCG